MILNAQHYLGCSPQDNAINHVSYGHPALYMARIGNMNCATILAIGRWWLAPLAVWHFQ